MEKPQAVVEKPQAVLLAVPVSPVLSDATATNLRRWGTALLIISMINFKSLDGWCGFFAALTILCTSSQALGLSSRAVRTSSVLSAIFAFVFAAAIVGAIQTGMPHLLGTYVESRCNTMPPDTFEWVRAIAAEHRIHHHYHSRDFLDGSHDLSERHHDEDERDEHEHHHAHMMLYMTMKVPGEPAPPALKDSSAKTMKMDGPMVAATPMDVSEPSVNQAEFCASLDRVVSEYGDVFLTLVVLFKLLLFATAVCVAKKAARLHITPTVFPSEFGGF